MKAKEGEEAVLKPPAPMMPSLLNTFNNRAFTLLLPAWICTVLVFAKVLSRDFIVKVCVTHVCELNGARFWFFDRINH
jgi:hypothetical protein